MDPSDRLRRAFEENFTLYDELGASVSVWKNGSEVISLHAGHTAIDALRPWTADTLVPVFSATKGLSSASLLHALHHEGRTPGLRAGDLWPRFPLPDATLAQVMSHQCGLAALDRTASLFDHDDCVRAIEETVPAWGPPEHGYHPHTFGPIMNELMLRLTGATVADYWEEAIRQPLGIDCYLNLPESEYGRVATLYPAKADKDGLDTPFYREYLTPGNRIYRSFRSLSGLGSVRSMNTPAAWTCGSPALGGVASARGMAAFYQACLDRDGLFPEEVRIWMQTVVVDGPDLTMLTPTAYSCGFMLDPLDPQTGRALRRLLGGRGFGHAGAGGSHAFADPATGYSFAYAMNHMDLNVLPGKKTARLVEALFGADL